MSKIIVFKFNTTQKMGKGDGSIDREAGTAIITSWDTGEKASLLVNTKYTLKSQGKIYSCNCIDNNLPARFDNVE